MKLWLDAQLPPQLAQWISATFEVDAVAVRDVGLRQAKDAAIFDAARKVGAVVVTKDRDFVDLVQRHGPPPQVVWVTCGNTSNARMREILARTFAAARALLEKGDPLVEVRDAAEN